MSGGRSGGRQRGRNSEGVGYSGVSKNTRTSRKLYTTEHTWLLDGDGARDPSPLCEGVRRREPKGALREHEGAGPESSGDAKIGSYESRLQL